MPPAMADAHAEPLARAFVSTGVAYHGAFVKPVLNPASVPPYLTSLGACRTPPKTTTCSCSPQRASRMHPETHTRRRTRTKEPPSSDRRISLNGFPQTAIELTVRPICGMISVQWRSKT